MFFILSKTLDYLLMPFLWVLLLLLFAVFLKSAIWRRRSLLAAILILFILSNPFLSNEAWRACEVAATPLKQMEKYDAAIILTGVTKYDTSLPDRVHTKKGADRFLHPLQLYRLGKIKKFVISGGNGKIYGVASPESEQIKRILLLAGVPSSDIILETESRNTYENATKTAELLKKHPELKKLLLVTSAFHMRRSEACFQKAGLRPAIFSTDFYAIERSYMPDKLLIPDIYSFSDWHMLLHEIAGYIIYKMLGYC